MDVENAREEFADMLGINGAKLPAHIQVERAHPDDVGVGDDDKPTESPEEFITALDSADAVFEAEGDVTLRIGKKILKLRIKSVPLEFVQKELNLPQPKAPTRKYPRKGGGYITDETRLQEIDEPYRLAMMRYRNEVSWGIALHGTIGIYDAEGTVHPFVLSRRGKIVWGPTVQDRQQARSALEEMKLTAPQFNKWLDAISRLGGVKADEEEAEQDFLTDSAGNSGYL